MISSLQRRPSEATCAPRKRRPKGWTVERRARQSARARETQPWRHATGPRSETGKARSSMNGLKHGYRSRAHIFEMRQARYVLRLAARNIAIVNAYLRLRRLENSLRGKPQTPFSTLQLNHARDVLVGITSSPMPVRPTLPGIGFWPAQR
jgi:hypothetical protein